jgi:outer membrane protein OmpA-like peptidoglycan-associated protein
MAALALAATDAPQPESLQEFCPLYTVFFDEGSARLGPNARQVIDDWAAFARLADAPYNRFTIEAVAMDRSKLPFNSLKLSFRRGHAIIRYLGRHGFPANRFRIRAMGQSAERLEDPGLTPELNQATNRRATLILETTGANYTRVVRRRDLLTAIGCLGDRAGEIRGGGTAVPQRPRWS